MLSRVAVGEDLDRDGGLEGGSSGAVACGAGDVLGDRSFDHPRGGPQPPGGHEVVQDVAADDADEVDGGVGDDAGGLDQLVPGGAESDGEAGAVGVGVGRAIVASQIAIRSAW